MRADAHCKNSGIIIAAKKMRVLECLLILSAGDKIDYEFL
jgi:hypothetical protein